MSREDFIDNLRSAAYFLSAMRDLAEDPQEASVQILKKLRRGAEWLTPRTVEGFDVRDFGELPAAQKNQLQQLVDGFLAIARKTPSAGGATTPQVKRAEAHLKRIVAIVREHVLAEWSAAMEQLAQDVESWARKRDWGVLRDTTNIYERFLDTYVAPRVLIHTVDGRLLLNPVARFAAGSEGLVELCVMPSYDSARITRQGDNWHLQPLELNGRPQKWSEATFRHTVDQLIKSAWPHVRKNA